MEADRQKWGSNEACRYVGRQTRTKTKPQTVRTTSIERREAVEFGNLSDSNWLEVFEKRAPFGLQALARQSELTFEYVLRESESTPNISEKGC